MPTTISPPNRHEDAILIIQNTQDGDLLHPRDLALVERVVNGMQLSEEGIAYWTNLVESARNGRYTSDWFCGIEGLTRSVEGFVYWKGRCIEHYDLTPGREEWVNEQARILGAICRTLDSKGVAVSSSSVADFYCRMSCADGMDTPRYLVSWAMQPAGFQAIVVELKQMDRQALMQEVDLKTAESKAHLGVEQRAFRSMLIAKREDFENVTEGIRGDASWARRALQGAYKRSDAADAVLQQVTEAVPVDSLTTGSAIEDHFLQPILAHVSALADAELSKNEYRFERARG